MLDQGWCIGYDPRERWWGRIPQGLTDSGGIALVGELRPDLPKADAAVQWRIVRDWIAEFFEDQFEVAPESFITRLRPR